MDSHLVTVEVSVERCAHERVNLKGLAFDENWLERLDTETVQGRRTVQQNRVLLNDVFEHFPYLRATTLNHAFCSLNVLCNVKFDEALHDEWLEEFECHQLGKTALVQFQGWAGNDDRTTGVVNPLAEKVLTEASLLALQHVGQ